MGGRTKVETFSGYSPRFGHSLNSDSRHCRRHNRHMEDRPEFGHQIRKVQSRIRRVQSPRTTTIIKETRDDVRNLDTCKVQVQSPNGGKVQDKVQVQSPMWRESPGQSISSKSKSNQSERVKLANQVRAWAFGQVYKPSDQKACQRCWGSGLESLLKSDWIASKNEDKD